MYLKLKNLEFFAMKNKADFDERSLSLTISDENLKKADNKQIKSQKLKDRHNKLNNIQFDAP